MLSPFLFRNDFIFMVDERTHTHTPTYAYIYQLYTKSRELYQRYEDTRLEGPTVYFFFLRKISSFVGWIVLANLVDGGRDDVLRVLIKCIANHD